MFAITIALSVVEIMISEKLISSDIMVRSAVKADNCSENDNPSIKLAKAAGIWEVNSSLKFRVSENPCATDTIEFICSDKEIVSENPT